MILNERAENSNYLKRLFKFFYKPNNVCNVEIFVPCTVDMSDHSCK